MNKKNLILIILLLAALLSTILYVHRPIRYAVFAGYNADKTIHPYVITYLKGLNEVTDGVVYIADSELKEEEYQKLKGLVIHTEHIRHDEYDWGSYKRGFYWLKENGYLEKADEIIFANDSCYAPMKSFKPMFREMNKRKDLDFWGNTQCKKFSLHLQSYFLVFRKRILNSKSFTLFLNKIHHYDHPGQYVDEYEVILTSDLEKMLYKWDSYQPYIEPATSLSPDLNSFPVTMIKERNNQFLKRRTFTEYLEIKESTDDLLRYIYNTYPDRYKDIAQEIAFHFIPEDLRGKHE